MHGLRSYVHHRRCDLAAVDPDAVMQVATVDAAQFCWDKRIALASVAPHEFVRGALVLFSVQEIAASVSSFVSRIRSRSPPRWV